MSVRNRMFGEDSFTDEIETPQQAQLCVEYLASNEHGFRKSLQDEGLSYENTQETLKRLWTNLSASCKRVGYADVLLEQKEAQYR